MTLCSCLAFDLIHRISLQSNIPLQSKLYCLCDMLLSELPAPDYSHQLGEVESEHCKAAFHLTKYDGAGGALGATLPDTRLPCPIVHFLFSYPHHQNLQQFLGTYPFLGLKFAPFHLTSWCLSVFLCSYARCYL
jgi:hypothetical protein